MQGTTELTMYTRRKARKGTFFAVSDHIEHDAAIMLQDGPRTRAATIMIDKHYHR